MNRHIPRVKAFFFITTPFRRQNKVSTNRNLQIASTKFSCDLDIQQRSQNSRR